MSLSDDARSTSPSLIQRARALDPGAWRRLCEIYGPLVYGWARAKGLQDTDAADVGQEVFRTVAARLADFRRDRPGDTFRGWLWTITRHKLGDHFRARANRPQSADGPTVQFRIAELAEDPTDGSIGVADSAERRVLRRALALIEVEFEPKTWQAFWQTTVDERPADDVAAKLGMTRPAVRQAKYKVLRRLRAEMLDDVV